MANTYLKNFVMMGQQVIHSIVYCLSKVNVTCEYASKFVLPLIVNYPPA